MPATPAQYTQPGTLSGKLKLVALITTTFSATVTLVAALSPDLLTPTAWAAVAVWGNTLGALFGAYWGGTGTVVGEAAPEDAVESPPMDLHAPAPAPPEDVPPAQ